MCVEEQNKLIRKKEIMDKYEYNPKSEIGDTYVSEQKDTPGTPRERRHRPTRRRTTAPSSPGCAAARFELYIFFFAFEL